MRKARLAAMIVEATADRYGDSEQTTGWYTMLEEHLALPFETMLGVVANVARLDLRGDGNIGAICTRCRERQGSRRRPVWSDRRKASAAVVP